MELNEELISYENTTNEYFKEYKSLGGKKNKKDYRDILNIFFEETYDIFIDGNPIRHESRSEAIEAVIDNAGISVKEYNLIFESVDNVDSYT